MKEILTTHELARLLKLNPETIRRWVKKGMPCIRAGNHYRFVLNDVLKWLEKENENT